MLGMCFTLVWVASENSPINSVGVGEVCGEGIGVDFGNSEFSLVAEVAVLEAEEVEDAVQADCAE